MPRQSQSQPPFTGTSPRMILISVVLGVSALFAFQSAVIVSEGNIGILKKFGKAVKQLEPGLHFRIPLVQSLEMIEVRQRRNVERLAASTSEQLPINVVISINWTATRERVLELYRMYGGLDQFEDRILDPKLRSVAKAALAKFNAEQLIRDRNTAVAQVLAMMQDALSSFPIQIDSPQLETISLPQRYLEAVEAKMKAREEAKRAEFELARQRTEAQRAVNTAEADRDAARARADGQAYRLLKEAEAEATAIRARGEAEATALEKINAALENNPYLSDYIRAKRWNGQLPQTMLGGSEQLLFPLSGLPQQPPKQGSAPSAAP
ncbi:MAG: SPFH domain-containing protein [Myxococcota bacterium]|nr:SPFH domain-containing protein [Myxococcota bacterium]